MAKTLYAVVPDTGQRLTRTTSKHYKFVVIGKPVMAHRVASLQASRPYMERDFEFHATEANPETAQFKWTESERATHQRIAEGGKEAYVQQRIENHMRQIATQEAAGYYDRFLSLGWATSDRLARARLASVDKEAYREAQIIPVEGAE